MHIAEEFTYNADVETVFAMVTDPEFQARKADFTKAIKNTVEVEQTEGSTVVTTTRTISTDILPEQIRGFLGEALKIAQTDTWAPADAAGNRTGTSLVEIVGTPVSFTSTVTATGQDGITKVVIDGELTAKIPLMGGRIEKAAAPAIKAAIRAEHTTGEAWLAEKV